VVQKEEVDIAEIENNEEVSNEVEDNEEVGNKIEDKEEVCNEVEDNEEVGNKVEDNEELNKKDEDNRLVDITLLDIDLLTNGIVVNLLSDKIEKGIFNEDKDEE